MHEFDSSDAMGIRNTINEAIFEIKRACPTDKNHPYPEYIKELLLKLREAKGVLINRFGISG